MARLSRAKGVAFEREVAAIYTEAGFEVRGLEGAGDHLAMKFDDTDGPFRPLTIFSECKRHERLQLPTWLRQAAREAPAGTVPIVSFRQSAPDFEEAFPVYACLPLRTLLEML